MWPKTCDTRAVFREWEQIVEENGRITWFKAIGDARIRHQHWTCVMDTDLESHNMEHVGCPSRGWYLCDDMCTLSTRITSGWEEENINRFMAIYKRADGDNASRDFTPCEMREETRRAKELAKLAAGARVATWVNPVIHSRLM